MFRLSSPTYKNVTVALLLHVKNLLDIVHMYMPLGMDFNILAFYFFSLDFCYSTEINGTNNYNIFRKGEFWTVQTNIITTIKLGNLYSCGILLHSALQCTGF